MKYPISEEQIYAYRPKPFYFLTTCDTEEFTLEKVSQSLQELKDCGFGGFILFNKPYSVQPSGFYKEDYLSEQWFEMVRNFAIAAKEYKLQMWINDGYDFPPGNVGGKIEKIAPHLCQKYLVMDGAGKVCVQQAHWGFPAFEDPLSGQLFTQLVYDQYEKYVGEFFGDPIVGFFCDCDNRRVMPGAMLNENDPSRNYFPWSDDFEESFFARYGYNIMEYLPSVMGRENTQQAVDYWEHAGHLYQRWIRNNQQWLQKRGLLYTGHTGDTSPYLYAQTPRSSCLSEGRFSEVQSIFDLPGTDQELLALDGGRHMIGRDFYTPVAVWGQKAPVLMEDYYNVTHDVRTKQASSTAFIYDKEGVMCEMFAATNFGVSPENLRQIGAFQLMQGVSMIVPHAFHYRFHGIAKYFAPPEFSSRGMLGRSVRELNDELARIACMMHMGKPLYPVALLDPTEAVWRNCFEEEAYYAAVTALNRLPYGFVICDAKKAATMDFKVAVVAGITLAPDEVQALHSKGITVISGAQLDSLSAYVDCDVRFEGIGTPHFARRVIDGEEFVFVANIENEVNVEGTLYAYGRQKEISLRTGEIVYLSASFDNICPRAEGTYVADLPEQVQVRYLDENILPLECFQGTKGEIIQKTGESPALKVFFQCEQPLSGLKLYIPKTNIETEVMCNSQPLTYTDDMVYDDAYRVYTLSATRVGQNTLTIQKSGNFYEHDRIFLKGAFDCHVISEGDSGTTALNMYNLQVRLPETVSITLSQRTNTLKTDRSWALQGQCFYSGDTEYLFDVELPADGNYRLVLPKVRDVAQLHVNGEFATKCVWSPYELPFTGKKGRNTCVLRVTNSLANAFECYLEQSGLLAGGFVEKL